MKATPETITVKDLLDLNEAKMLIVNPEYQRGVVWSQSQKKKLVDSVLRGYPLPLIYLHKIEQRAGGLVSQRYEVIDGQQRINALSEYKEGAFKLFHPEKDAQEARFPEFIRNLPCPWGGKEWREIEGTHGTKFFETALPVVYIQTNDANEARDLFVRLQAGMPLNSQEKRDAWPGQFTDFVLRLGGKAGLARHPGHDFFSVLMKASKATDRGKFRQLAAQVAMLYFTRRKSKRERLTDINAGGIDSFYYENLGFEENSPDAKRLWEIMDKAVQLLRDGKRKKIIGHEAISIVLLLDSLWDDYTRSWERDFAGAFDAFRIEMLGATKSRNSLNPSPYWLSYGIHTRVNSDRGDNIRRRHEFFAERMLESMTMQPKDPTRGFTMIEREICYYRDGKRCGRCQGEVVWDEAEVHHVQGHAAGGRTTLANASLVHKHCHPKGTAATAEFAATWKLRGSNS